jgi:transposase InsO family protein
MHSIVGWQAEAVLSFNHSRRFLALHHRLEAVPNHEGRGCHRHAGPGAERHRVRPGNGSSTRPRLLSDNGPSYLAADLAIWPDGQNMEHVRGAPYRPLTQGKTERRHQTLKNRILLDNYYLLGGLEAQIEAFVVAITCDIMRASAT